MPKLEDAGSGRCQGHQEQDSVLQPEYDGGVSSRSGMLLRETSTCAVLTYFLAEQTDGQE